MRKTVYISFILLCYTLTGSFAQHEIENMFSSFEEIITEIASRTDNSEPAEELADRLYELQNNPVQINSANEESLARLFWLTEFQVQNIIKYVKERGPLQTVYELSYINGISEQDAKLMAPFIAYTLEPKPIKISPGAMFSQGKHQIIMRTQRTLENQKGFETPAVPTPSNHFTGDNMKYYLRYGCHYQQQVSFGFTADKDFGEQFFTGNNKLGFDFLSAHLQINDIKFVKTFVVGDYRLNFGQGLILWSGFNFGKSVSVMSSMQRNLGVNRYQSADENNFFRGSAITLEFNPIQFSVFYSRQGIDANITRFDSLSNKALEVSSLQTTGIHGTPAEIDDEDAITAEVAGSNISLVNTNFRGGFTALLYRYSAFLSPEIEPYNQFYFRGKSNINLSFDYKYRTGNLIFFGEEATSQNGAVALLNGLQCHISTRFQLNLVSRYYQRNFQAMYGNSFGENSRNNNESGIFAGAELTPLPFITLAGYVDVFRFPWLKYGVDMPSSGDEILLQVSSQVNNKLQMYLQYRRKQRDDNFANETDAKNQIVLQTSNRLRYNLSWLATDRIKLQNRLEWTQYKNEVAATSNGFYMGQSIAFSLSIIPVKLYLNYALFDTDNYNTRIYAYESDLLYTFSIPAFADRGSRWYAMASWSPGKNTDVWVKYGITNYSNKETVGSGLYESSGNRRSEVKMQVILKF